jgi:DNA repair ATPase RecN
MGLFSKKKEQKPVPRPLPPFMNNSNQDNSNQLKNQITSNQSNLSMEPTTLPKLPELNETNNMPDNLAEKMPSMDNINNSLENANQKMNEINDRMNNMNSMTPENNNQNDVSVFIRVDKYNEVIKTVNNMEHKINELRHTISRLTEIRNNEQKLIDSWNSLIQEAENRIREVTSKLPPAKK